MSLPGHKWLELEQPSLEVEEQELAWDGEVDVELGLTNTSATATCTIGSATRPLALATLQHAATDLASTKVGADFSAVIVNIGYGV